MRVVDGVHGRATYLGTQAEPAAAAGLAEAAVLVVLVADDADRCAAVYRHEAHFATRQAHLSVCAERAAALLAGLGRGLGTARTVLAVR